MNIVSIYKQFPTQLDCIKHLEKVRWNNQPVCPYCNSKNQTPLPKEQRYHCNNCNTTFSVTVHTIFHKTKCDLQKWFLAISLTLNAKKGISARQLSRDIEVTKDTAWYMMMRIRKAFEDKEGELLEGIIECDETYVGGKNKNRHKDKKTEGGQGRGGEDKTPVFATLQRDGKVKAQKVKDVSSKSLHTIIKQNVKEGSTLMTDEWRAYNGLALLYGHEIVRHAMKEYVNGACHTNTLEGFWSLLKRGVIGQYHYVTPRYLNKYIDEFCYRYNNRKNINTFSEVILKAVSI
jgi:transposase-like protein